MKTEEIKVGKSYEARNYLSPKGSNQEENMIRRKVLDEGKIWLIISQNGFNLFIMKRNSFAAWAEREVE